MRRDSWDVYLFRVFRGGPSLRDCPNKETPWRGTLHGVAVPDDLMRSTSTAPIGIGMGYGVLDHPETSLRVPCAAASPGRAIPSSIIEPVRSQFAGLLPPYQDTHPLGCHRPCIPDRLGFDVVMQVLVVACTCWRIADGTRSATTLRRRRGACLTAGGMDTLREPVQVAAPCPAAVTTTLCSCHGRRGDDGRRGSR
jgi:hypothetical protein